MILFGATRARALARYFRLVRSTSRVKITGEYRGGIVALWHDSLYAALVAAPEDPDLAIYAWSDPRARLMARVAERLGIHVIGSSRRNRYGMRDVIQWLKSPQRTLVIAVDGPLGPARVAKPGALRFATAAGVSVYTARVGVNGCQLLKSWDERCLPDPGCAISVALSPLSLPRENDVAAREALQTSISSTFLCGDSPKLLLHTVAGRWARSFSEPAAPWGRVALGPLPSSRPS